MGGGESGVGVREKEVVGWCGCEREGGVGWCGCEREGGGGVVWV